MDCGVKSREVELGVLITLKNIELVKTISTIANTNHVGHFEIIFHSITFFLFVVAFILFCFIMASSKTLGVCVELLVVSIPIAMHVVLAFIKDFRVAKDVGLSLSRARFNVVGENVVRGCWFGDLSPWIYIVRWCKVRRGRRLCSCGSLPVCSSRSCGVPPEVSGASRSAEEVLFQGNATYSTTEDTSSVDPSLVCLPRPCGGPPLAQSAYHSDVAVVYEQNVSFSCCPVYAIHPRDVPSTTFQTCQ